MKIQVLIIFTFFNISSLMMIQGAEEEPKRGTVQFYEKLYKTKINGVKPIEEFSDRDQFFTAIAGQVGIPKLGIESVEKKFHGIATSGLGRLQKSGPGRLHVFGMYVVYQAARDLQGEIFYIRRGKLAVETLPPVGVELSHWTGA